MLPLLKSAWPEEWEKEAEKKWLWWSGLVEGWGESRSSCVCLSRESEKGLVLQAVLGRLLRGAI